jgi:homoserine O-acetyltransferase
MKEHRDLWWESPTTELGKVVQLDLAVPFRADHGGYLPSIQVSYESWGEPNETQDNAVLVIHPMTADCHATGEFAGQAIGWWEPLIGPGRAIDTDRYFVVCPNLIGGCYGTTGPRFPAIAGDPYLDEFPLLTPRDMMRVQRLFVERLGIRKLALAIGPSMGGMIAWEWAIEAPELVEHVAVVAAPVRTSPHQIGLNWLQRRGIELDFTENEQVATQGQMVARGVGMLSYRSPVGLEEKFGREWFKEPGATLRERGMYNIESWLRHHGRRITKRFDPYTYLLFSRAMDLHDVSEGRGDLVSALDRVTCRVMVIGVSSDFLYPRDEVKLGADVLEHLGRDVRFEEVRSPNGHDAFLLDTDQIATFVERFLAHVPAVTTPIVTRETRRVRAAVLGAGKVAASLLRLVRARQDQIRERNGLVFEIAGVAEIARDKVLDPVFDGLDVTHDPAALVERQGFDVLLDLTRGLGTYELVQKALNKHHPVVTPNKVLLRAHGEALDRLAFQQGVRLAYHDSIAAGWPLILALEQPLARGDVREIRAVLSSACNVMLELIEGGRSLQEAAGEAQARDLTEPDPELDISGWDSAQKLKLLLARITGKRYVGQEMETEGLESVDPALVRLAAKEDLRVKLVAFAATSNGSLTATVRPMAVRADGHLGMVKGPHNVVVTHAPDGGEMVYSGTGGGALPVATAVLNDLIGVFDPQHSWTGRFPAVDAALTPPEFDRWLVPEGGGARIVGSAREGAIPVLPVLRFNGTAVI